MFADPNLSKSHLNEHQTTFEKEVNIRFHPFVKTLLHVLSVVMFSTFRKFSFTLLFDIFKYESLNPTIVCLHVRKQVAHFGVYVIKVHSPNKLPTNHAINFDMSLGCDVDLNGDIQ